VKPMGKDVMYRIDKDEIHRAGVRFPNEVCSPWDLVKAIEWAMVDHLRKFHMEKGVESDVERNEKGE